GGVGGFEGMELAGCGGGVGGLGTRGAVRLFHQAVDEMIAMRSGCDVPAMGPPRDLLTLMLNARDPETGRPLSSAEIRANVIPFMSAGHESTDNAIAWTLFLLSKSSAWRERVVEEATRELDGPAERLPDRLVETHAVVEEALRLYPPLAAISRVARGSDELAGAPIRAGAMIVIAPYVLHRHRLWRKEPELFSTARFQAAAPASIDRYRYMPFGAS